MSQNYDPLLGEPSRTATLLLKILGSSTVNVANFTANGNVSFGLLKANSTVISANALPGITATFLANGVANTVHITNGIITSVS